MTQKPSELRVFSKRLWVLRELRSAELFNQVLAVLLFAGMLSIAFLEPRWYILTWFAFVPLLFAIEGASLLKTYLLGVLAGLMLFASATYWVADFVNLARGKNELSNLVVSFLYWLYCAQLIAILFVLLNWLRANTRIHDFLLFPVLVVTVTSIFPMVFSMQLGQSQIHFHYALQAIEFFGVHALDAVIALFNIMFFHLVSSKLHTTNSQKIHSDFSWIMGMSTLIIWFAYGIYAFHSWEEEISTWETTTVGIVQPNEAPSRKERNSYSGYSKAYPPELDMSERLASFDAEIIIWPEASQKYYLDNAYVRKAYQSSVEKMGASLLFQDTQNIVDLESTKEHSKFNAAVMLNDNGKPAGRYNKIKRIPFGEYIPLLPERSYLRHWTEGYLGSFYADFTAGESHQLFQHASINIIPLICYETTFPRFVAEAVKSTVKYADQTNGTVLVGLSNDGWFNSTHQSNQHVMASVLRAVENRLPLIHVVNNGPSIAVNPNGKIIFESDANSAGGYLVSVPHSNTAQGSFYSRNSSFFSFFIYACFLAFILRGLVMVFQKQ
jgi:apolipoprotein N-acyltransferase